jgi:hypothetical protein
MFWNVVLHYKGVSECGKQLMKIQTLQYGVQRSAEQIKTGLCCRLLLRIEVEVQVEIFALEKRAVAIVNDIEKAGRPGLSHDPSKRG